MSDISRDLVLIGTTITDHKSRTVTFTIVPRVDVTLSSTEDNRELVSTGP